MQGLVIVKTMAGIYIHIPFCRKACHYCNFHFSTSLALKSDFVAALLREVEMVAPLPFQLSVKENKESYLGGETINTIYFGGGTPSLLSENELTRILHKLRTHFTVESEAEITLEANPDDVSINKLKEWKAAGINRLSLGVQSFSQEDLQWMNRAHNATQALYSILMAQEEGFNITVDLIYGTPGLSDRSWEQNIRQAIQLKVPHLSCYALTVEPSTALHKMIRVKESLDIDEDKQARQFLLLTDWMQATGYEQYEISNFAKPGKRSQHNSSYWKGKKYLGLGPSAHSFNGTTRQWNVANNALYIQSLLNNMLPSEMEILTPIQQVNEYIMVSLRMSEGLDLEYLANEFGKDALTHVQQAAQKYIDSGKIRSTTTILQLTREGKLFADGIAAGLFK